jgi:spermidine synthase
MIDQRGPIRAPRLALTLPVPAGAARVLLLAAVFVCAACGLVYELELVALASYLVGDSVTQASIVLSVMVFAMGCGSLLAKRLRTRPALGFAAVEAALALVGGLSVMALYAVFAWYGEAKPAIAGCSFSGSGGRTRAARSPTCSRRITWARWSAGSPFRFCCCRSSGS